MWSPTPKDKDLPLPPREARFTFWGPGSLEAQVCRVDLNVCFRSTEFPKALLPAAVPALSFFASQRCAWPMAYHVRRK